MFANINLKLRKFTHNKATSRRRKSHSSDCCTTVNFVQRPFEVYHQNSVAMLIRDLVFRSRLKLSMFDRYWTQSTEFQSWFAVLSSPLHPIMKYTVMLYSIPLVHSELVDLLSIIRSRTYILLTLGISSEKLTAIQTEFSNDRRRATSSFLTSSHSCFCLQDWRWMGRVTKHVLAVLQEH